LSQNLELSFLIRVPLPDDEEGSRTERDDYDDNDDCSSHVIDPNLDSLLNSTQ
jgi:hypothetical protein